MNDISKKTKVIERKMLFDSNWKFHFGELSYEEALVETDYIDVTLPHDWLTEYEASEKDPATQAMNWKYGVGMYKKTFTLPEELKGKVLLLHFDGSYQNTTVTLNGKVLGNIFYGYIPFEYEITDTVDFEGENQLVVTVNNSEQPNTRWYSGSGITRDVWLIAVDPVHVHSEGSYIVTKKIYRGLADISIQVELDNATCEQKSICLTNEVYDPEGKLVNSMSRTVVLGAGSVQNAFTDEMTIRTPYLWSPDAPNLYTCKTVLADGEKVLDVYETVFGIRTIEFDPMKGFLLNDEHLKIRGMAIHNDAGTLGAAVPVKVWERRLKKLKAMGCNGIRTAHNPADPLLMDLMDRLGFLVMDEFFDEWTYCKGSKSRGNKDYPARGYAEHFWADHERDMETIIRRDRNHPCVILWSVGNEVEEIYAVDGHEVMAHMREVTHKLDPTRPVTQGSNPLAHNSKYTYEKFLAEQDVKGCNWFNIWVDRAELFYGPDKIKHPDWSFLVTETGGLSGARGGYKLMPRRQGNNPFASPYYTRAVAASKHLREIEIQDYISGVYYWTGVSYMGESVYPHRGNTSNPIDLAGFINDNWYFYKSFWKKDEPTLYLMPNWNMEEEEGKIIPVVCYTSCPTVELFLNGKSYGEKAYLYPDYGIDEWPNFDMTKPYANTDDMFLTWDVPYIPGELVAVGYDREGNEIARQTLRTAGPAAAIQACVDSTEIAADGRDIAQIEISLLDEKGDLAVTAENELTVTVSGSGKLLALENSNTTDHRLGKNPKRTAHFGLLLAVIQSTDEAGEIEVTIEGEGLKGCTVKLAAK